MVYAMKKIDLNRMLLILNGPIVRRRAAVAPLLSSSPSPSLSVSPPMNLGSTLSSTLVQKIQNKRVHPMLNLARLVLILGGVVLFVMGVIATDSVSSSFSRFFTGNPSDHSIWLMLGGLAAMAVGGSLYLRNDRTAS